MLLDQCHTSWIKLPRLPIRVSVEVDSSRFLEELSSDLPSSKEGVVLRLVSEHSAEVPSGRMPSDEETLAEIYLQRRRVLYYLGYGRPGVSICEKKPECSHTHLRAA